MLSFCYSLLVTSKGDHMKAHIEIDIELDIDWDYSDDFGVEAELTNCYWKGASIMGRLTAEQRKELEQYAIDNSHDDRGNEQ